MLVDLPRTLYVACMHASFDSAGASPARHTSVMTGMWSMPVRSVPRGARCKPMLHVSKLILYTEKEDTGGADTRCYKADSQVAYNLQLSLGSLP